MLVQVQRQCTCFMLLGSIPRADGSAIRTHLQDLAVSAMLQAQWIGVLCRNASRYLAWAVASWGLVPGFTLNSHLAISAALVLLSQLFPSGSVEASGRQVHP